MPSTNNIKIIPYRDEHQPWFESLNRAWIEKFFWMEPVDVAVLQHPKEHILDKDGCILMATCDDEIVATVALRYVSPGIYEFTKMAVLEGRQGQGIGEVLARAAIEKARALRATAIILFSSRKLKPAIALYRKLGFREVPVDAMYKRSDIKMKILLTDNDVAILPYDIRRATKDDAALLASIGAVTFEETFREQNAPEDMKLYIEQNFTPAKLEEEMNIEGTVFIIAFAENETAGFAKIRRSVEHHDGIDNNKAYELERIYVTKPFLSKKAGYALMDASLALIKSMGYSMVWLGVWEHNYRALSFYQKWGFEKFGSHPFLLGNDLQTDLILTKAL